jgi:hypothetical protein
MYSVENAEGMFISREKILFLALSVDERKDLVDDDQHGGGRATGHLGGQISAPDKRAVCPPSDVVVVA